MARIPPARRPHYLPPERLAILELRAARGWSQAKTADIFQVSADTIAEDGAGIDARSFARPGVWVRISVPQDR